jgi:hydrogenase expression/formation protein HypE
VTIKTRKLPVGKVPWDLVAGALEGALPPDVVLGPAVGEDAALVKIGGELWAVASDPISFTAADAGRLAVMVNANDVAVRGAEPRFFLAVVLLAPDEADEARVEEILMQIRGACSELDVAVIGGHTEVTPNLAHSMVIGTMLGRVGDRPITTGGLRAGDWVGLTKWAGLEGTSILLAEFGNHLHHLHTGELAAFAHILGGEWLSVVPEAMVAASNPHVSALHDVTEGGVGEAIYEMERASGLRIRVDEEVPIRRETKLVCADLGMNPLGLIGSGALLVGCGDEGREALATDLKDAGIPFAWIGRAETGGEDPVRGLPRFERDEILKAWSLDGLRAVIFDMDGTLIDSDYDWPVIRERLGVRAASIIDELNGLPDPERALKWRELEGIEKTATNAARLKTGVKELLAFLGRREIPTALVTNNTRENTSLLLDRFDLSFDVVLTRDSGLWKPSGAPISAAMGELGVPPEHCLAVGDSRYDIQAAREAECGRVCVLYDGAERYREQADLAFPDLEALTRYLEIVL